MELNHLRYFFEVARRGSFTAASRSLRVSQPSISRMVAQLEAKHETRLLERGRKGIRLTSDGRVFFERCEIIFGEVERLKRSIERGRREIRGTLSLGASDNLSNYVLPGFFQEFWTHYPTIKIQLLSGTSMQIRDEILGKDAELGLFYTMLKEPSLEQKRITSVEFVIVCSPGNLKLKERGRTPASLSDLFYIGSRLTDYRHPYCSLKMLEDQGIRPKLFFETNSQETQKRMAMLEKGYTVLPRFMVREEIRSGSLVIVPTPKRLSADLYLARKKGRALSQAAEIFVGYLRERLEQLV